MASGFSIWYANQILDKAVGNSDFTPPTDMWVALFTDPSSATHLRNNDIVSAVEASGGSYARVAILGATGIDFSLASGGSVSQDSEIVFPTATGSWGTIYSSALLDVSDNVIIYDDWDVPEEVTAPDTVRIPVANLIISL